MASPHPWEVEHRLCYWHGPRDETRARVAPWLTGIIADVRTGWIVFIDDDNRLHPDLPRRLWEVVETNPTAQAVAFDCQYPAFGGVLRVAPGRVRPGSVDGGQVALRYDLAQAAPWAAGGFGDGHYLQALYNHAPDAWVFVNEALTYHNHQEWAP